MNAAASELFLVVQTIVSLQGQQAKRSGGNPAKALKK